MKIQLTKVEILKSELGEYKDYIGHLFQNENGVYNICRTEEDVIKSNQWFKNFPIKVAILDVEDFVKNIDCKVGDKIFPYCRNEELHYRVFEIKKILKKDLVELIDDKGNKVVSTKYILLSPKFIRWNNEEDNSKIITSQSLEIYP